MLLLWQAGISKLSKPLTLTMSQTMYVTQSKERDRRLKKIINIKNIMVEKIYRHNFGGNTVAQAG